MRMNICIKSMKIGVISFFLLSGLMYSSALAQQTTIRGTVTDSQTGEPLPSVNILVKGTSIGTATNADGTYKLQVPSLQDTLRFSFIGYQTQIVPINGRTNIDISFEPKAVVGEELVVVGYGTQQSSQVTRAISSVDGQVISNKGTVGALQALQGEVAGVDITANSGRVGSGYNIKIRGQSSLAGGEPLYVVDGVVVDGIKFLNPQSIKKINILKDAASTAIYGSRGSNGVVIVTTKSGSSLNEQIVISYDGSVGFSQNVRMPDFMNGTEWWEFRQGAYITDALQSGEPYDETIGGVANSELLARRLENKNYTNWPSYFLRTGVRTNQWVSIAGNTDENLRYVIGGGYQHVKGNLLGSHYNRYNFKASVDHKINEIWSAGLSINLAVSERELGSQNAIQTAYRMSPLVAPYDSTGELLFRPGKYAGIGFTSSVNPLWELKDSKNNRRRTYGVGSIYIELSPIDWLSIRSTFSPQFEFERHGVYYGPHTEARGLEDGASNLEKDQSLSYTWNNKISVVQHYGDHHFEAMGLFSVYYDRSEESGIEVANLPYNSLFYNLGTASTINEVSSGFSRTTLLSYMGRLNYSYQNKYLLTIAVRWDGSSKLAEGYKWAMFPSASVGWRITEEDFFDVSMISKLKLRVSYGYSGNNNISPYSTLQLAGRQFLYDFGGDLAKGIAPTGIVNRRLTWEKTREYDIGLDFGLFNNRVTGSVDYYNKLSKKLLIDRDLPMESGYSSMIDNVGKVKNTGIEISLQTLNITTQNFSWRTSFSFAKNHNEIVSLYGEKKDDVGNRWFIGEPINVNYTYVFDGIWQKNEEQKARSFGQSPGQAKVKDLNKDGAINGQDRRIIGTPKPEWTGGFSTRITYGQFYVSMSIYARQGVQVFSPFHAEFLNLNDRGRSKLDVPYYMPENDVILTRYSNSYPQPHNIGPYWDEVGYYKDASFIKVQNISLGYNFAPDLLSKVNIKNLRIYLNVLNPFVWTDYTGFDPEWASSEFDKSGNSLVTYQLGVNLKF